MKFYLTKTKVETVSGKYIGIITAFGATGITNESKYYIVSLFINGEYRKVELKEYEFKVIGEPQTMQIDFKNEAQNSK